MLWWFQNVRADGFCTQHLAQQREIQTDKCLSQTQKKKSQSPLQNIPYSFRSQFNTELGKHAKPVRAVYRIQVNKAGRDRLKQLSLEKVSNP